jgi:hypothetical protein
MAQLSVASRKFYFCWDTPPSCGLPSLAAASLRSVSLCDGAAGARFESGVCVFWGAFFSLTLVIFYSIAMKSSPDHPASSGVSG